MAKQRLINTRLWNDTWVLNLDPIEKLLFLYLLTNEHTEISGVYELPTKLMTFETGIEKEMIEKILQRFEADGKIKYAKGWIYIINFIKYQENSSEKVKIGINNALSRVPRDIIDTLCIPYAYPSVYFNSNSNPNLNLNSNRPGGATSKKKKNPQRKADRFIAIFKEEAKPSHLDGDDNSRHAAEFAEKFISYVRSQNWDSDEESVQNHYRNFLRVVLQNEFYQANMTSMAFQNRNFQKLINEASK